MSDTRPDKQIYTDILITQDIIENLMKSRFMKGFSHKDSLLKEGVSGGYRIKPQADMTYAQKSVINRVRALSETIRRARRLLRKRHDTPSIATAGGREQRALDLLDTLYSPTPFGVSHRSRQKKFKAVSPAYFGRNHLDARSSVGDTVFIPLSILTIGGRGIPQTFKYADVRATVLSAGLKNHGINGERIHEALILRPSSGYVPMSYLRGYLAFTPDHSVVLFDHNLDKARKRFDQKLIKMVTNAIK